MLANLSTFIMSNPTPRIQAASKPSYASAAGLATHFSIALSTFLR